jgi:hypothetical protein
MIARKNPVTAPRNASVIERLLNCRSPWPVKTNPVYAIATVQRITRIENMGDYLSMSKYCHNSLLGSESFLRSPPQVIRSELATFENGLFATVGIAPDSGASLRTVSREC